ncbi:hypothetical protein [Mycolicibacterium pyrenivorans]|uniref:hypothetical protein n=1 Tax=Mycolicibacterium pyrenivorans TaxID=187102 RepID=UPI0021F32E41|nr:hypothetical protein [Mycolicibacterium pyrenivorans]MCV7150606.1 hypothetical protein [Mycolicibacterium pyrenivorans]
MVHPESAEFAAITDSLTLWRLLVSGTLSRPLPPGIAIDTFQRLHGGGEPGACDSPCCCAPTGAGVGSARKVIAGVVETGILGDDGQGRLANTVLRQKRVHYRHPIWWIDTSFVESDLSSPPDRAGRSDGKPSQGSLFD